MSPTSSSTHLLHARQQGSGGTGGLDGTGNPTYNPNDDPYYYNSTWYYARYGIVAGIFLLAAIFILVAHQHARRRMRAGLPPLPYHAWLVRRQYNNNHHSQYPMYGNGTAAAPPRPETYPMNDHYAHPAPPPPYQPPPVYQPPQGGSKVLADQSVAAVGEAPLPPPPREEGAAAAGRT